MKTQKPDRTRVISLDDLAPRADVKGGAGARVFGQSDTNPAAADVVGGKASSAKRGAVKDGRPSTNRK